MATKTKKQTKATENTDDSSDDAAPEGGPVIDSLGATIKKMLAKGKERGYVTYDELNTALPPEQFSSEQIEDVMANLNEMGINVVENDDAEDNASASDDSSDDDKDSADEPETEKKSASDEE
jgi:RNA polymerase primary sigma factor